MQAIAKAGSAAMNEWEWTMSRVDPTVGTLGTPGMIFEQGRSDGGTLWGDCAHEEGRERTGATNYTGYVGYASG